MDDFYWMAFLFASSRFPNRPRPRSRPLVSGLVIEKAVIDIWSLELGAWSFGLSVLGFGFSVVGRLKTVFARWLTQTQNLSTSRG